MVRTRTSHYILWPSYFDQRRTRMKGRRVPKNLAVEKPTFEAISKAVKALGIEAIAIKEKSYPGNWCEKEGMVRVPKSMPKAELIRKVAEKMKELR
jgi:signal recognition particle subunit SRP19